MYLVDTAVWVDYINDVTTPATDLLDTLLRQPMVAGINAQIYLEILQGARNEAGFAKLQAYFASQKIYRFADEVVAHAAAAELYFKARRRGFILRSSLHCLIGQCALEHELILLHHDRDFVGLAKGAPLLQQQHFLR